MDIYELLAKLSVETVYLYDHHEDCVVRSEPPTDSNNYWVNFKGTAEYFAKHDCKLIMEARIPQNIITKEEYDNF